MKIYIDNKDTTPLYQQIVNSIYNDIKTGKIPSGLKLPTVRDLAEDIGISKGTIKHAYDELEQMGVIEMLQGKGSFVMKKEDKDITSKKQRAMTAIDKLLNELEALDFTNREMQIYIDLKLREREEEHEMVRIAVIDCNPEVLDIIYKQLSQNVFVEVAKFPLQRISSDMDKLNQDYDMVITTSNHYEQVAEYVKDMDKLARTALTLSEKTIIALAQLTDAHRVGIISASKSFEEVIRKSCKGFGKWAKEMKQYTIGDEKRLKRFIKENDILIVPPNYLDLCDKTEKATIQQGIVEGNNIIIYFDYKVDKGSLMYLGELIKRCVNSKRMR